MNFHKFYKSYHRPILGDVVIELHILVVGNVCQATAGYRLFVLDWSSSRVGVLRYLEQSNKENLL